jgi:hypothetical protein
MKKFGLVLTLLAALVLAGPVAADPVDPPQPAATAENASGGDSSEPYGDPDEEATVEDLAGQLGKVISDWENLGWMGGVVALIGLLLMALRFKPLNQLLEDKGLKWIKPYVAAGLGSLFGFFSSFSTGAGWAQSIIAGILLGLAAPGLHLVLTKGNKK